MTAIYETGKRNCPPGQGGDVRQVRLDPYWTRIDPPTRRHNLIGLESRGVKVEVGGFVSEKVRRQVAQELRRELAGTSVLDTPHR